MGDFFSAIKKCSGFVWVPVWSGLLLLPLAGAGNAVRIAAIAGLCVALWHLAKTEAVANFNKAISNRFSRLQVTAARVTSPVQSSAGLVGAVILLVLLPLFLNNYYRDIMTLTCMYIVLALGLNITVGQAGLLNLGYAAFYAIGAYTYAILSTVFGVSFWPGILAGALTAALFAV